MRYYDITVTEPNGGAKIKRWTSYDEKNNITIASAQNVELDMPQFLMGDTSGIDNFVRIWGVPLSDIGQASNLTYKNITIKAGYKDGLPLATALNKSGKSGLIAKGYITNSFGNWVGTDMTIDLYVCAGSISGGDEGGFGTPDNPKNIVLPWTKGMSLRDALESCLKTAFPDNQVSISIDDSLIAPEDLQGPYPSLNNLARFVKSKSLSLKNQKGYAGVGIWPDNNGVIHVDDFTNSSGKAVNILFQELIGQPTYGVPSGYCIQFMCPLRSDLAIGTRVKLPKTQVITTPTAQSGLLNSAVNTGDKTSTIISGEFICTSVRHVGNYRQTDGQSWCTIVNAAYALGSGDPTLRGSITS